MKINEIVQYLNEHFSQDSPEYSIFFGTKPQVLRLDNETAVSTWGCGAIVCIGRSVIFIEEDDGNWFAPEYINGNRIHDELSFEFWKKHPIVGCQTPFSLGWGDSFINAFQRLNEYVKTNGVPYYYAGTDTICGYELK